MDIRDEAMQLRNEKHQMIKTGLNAKMENSHDLAVVYTPGVAAPCLSSVFTLHTMTFSFSTGVS